MWYAHKCARVGPTRPGLPTQPNVPPVPNGLRVPKGRFPPVPDSRILLGSNDRELIIMQCGIYSRYAPCQSDATPPPPFTYVEERTEPTVHMRGSD
jgi:hypothetical protein